jgi:hypothetical protein
VAARRQRSGLHRLASVGKAGVAVGVGVASDFAEPDKDFHPCTKAGSQSPTPLMPDTLDRQCAGSP